MSINQLLSTIIPALPLTPNCLQLPNVVLKLQRNFQQHSAAAEISMFILNFDPQGALEPM